MMMMESTLRKKETSFSSATKSTAKVPILDATRHKQLIGALPSERTILQAPHSVQRLTTSSRNLLLGPAGVVPPSTTSKLPSNNNTSNNSTNSTDLPPITSYRSEDGSRLFVTCGKTFVSRLNADSWRRYCVLQYQEQIIRNKTSNIIHQSIEDYYHNSTNGPNNNVSVTSSRQASRESSPEIKRTITFSVPSSPQSSTFNSRNSMLNTSNSKPTTPIRPNSSSSNDHTDTDIQPPKSPYQIYMSRSPRKETLRSPSTTKTVDFNMNNTNLSTIIESTDLPSTTSSTTVLPPPPTTTTTTTITTTTAILTPAQTELDQRFASVENQLKNILIENKLLREKLETSETLIIQINLDNHKYQNEIERLQNEIQSNRKLLELSRTTHETMVQTKDQENQEIQRLQQDIHTLKNLILEKDQQINIAHEKEQELRQEIASLTMRAAAATGMALLRVGSNTSNTPSTPKLNTASTPQSSRKPSITSLVLPEKSSTIEETEENTTKSKEEETSNTTPSTSEKSTTFAKEKSPLAKRRWQALSTYNKLVP